MITKTKLILIDSAVALSSLDIDGVASALTSAFHDTTNGFTTVARQAAFIGQLCVESAHFSTFKENLNYSTDGLMRNFPSHFTDAADASHYAHHPDMIANRVYANRMGNGSEASGDGWMYRGRGFIQLTGKDNYRLFGKASDPDYLTTMFGAVESAVWFYTVKHNLNPFADAGDIKSITHVINGGYAGLAERIKYYQSALNILPL